MKTVLYVLLPNYWTLHCIPTITTEEVTVTSLLVSLSRASSTALPGPSSHWPYFIYDIIFQEKILFNIKSKFKYFIFLKKISFITLRSYQTRVKQKMWIMDDDLSSYFLFPSSICHDIGLAITKLRIITERNDPPGHNSELTTPLIDQYKEKSRALNLS